MRLFEERAANTIVIGVIAFAILYFFLIHEPTFIPKQRFINDCTKGQMWTRKECAAMWEEGNEGYE